MRKFKKSVSLLKFVLKRMTERRRYMELPNSSLSLEDLVHELEVDLKKEKEEKHLAHDELMETRNELTGALSEANIKIMQLLSKEDTRSKSYPLDDSTYEVTSTRDVPPSSEQTPQPNPSESPESRTREPVTPESDDSSCQLSNSEDGQPKEVIDNIPPFYVNYCNCREDHQLVSKVCRREYIRRRETTFVISPEDSPCKKRFKTFHPN